MKNNDDHIQTFSDYIQYFAPDFTLHPDVSTKQENLNTKQVHLEISFSHFDTAEEVLDWKENFKILLDQNHFKGKKQVWKSYIMCMYS